MLEARGNALIWHGNGEYLRIDPWGPSAVRVRSRLLQEPLDTDFALLSVPAGDCQIEIDEDEATLTNGNVTVTLSQTVVHDPNAYQEYDFRCLIEIRRSDGQLLLREMSSGGSLNKRARAFEPSSGDTHQLRVAFEAIEGERFYGMGQYQEATFDRKGSTLELAQRNSQASVPFVLSNQGYGFLWHNPSIGTVTFGTNRTEWTARSTRQMDYWVTAGFSPSEILDSYTAVTGRVPHMPERGLGFWQCKLRYWNQEQLLDVAREYHRREIPVDVIVCDFFHWPRLGDFRFDESFFPDPKAMVDELTSLNMELMVSVWPQVSKSSENYREMRENNLLVTTEHGLDIQMRFQDPSVFYDTTNPRAREFVWDLCKKNYYDYGIRTFWLDEAEPEFETYDYSNYRYHEGSVLEVGNIYPQRYAQGFYEGLKAQGEDDVINLLRCAWAGSQRYGTLVWSGDIPSTWDALRNQLVAGLHMGIAGIAWWTTDIGGFWGGDPQDADYQELLIRWFQWGTFCPVMRLHGFRVPESPVTHLDGRPNCSSGADNEVWSYGEEAYSILKRHILLREAMRPYSRAVMEEAHTTGAPVMRPMFFEFPNEDNLWAVSDQYMFGSELLVAPILERGQHARSVYLPEGMEWINAYTGETFAGGQAIDVPAPIEQIPLFVKAPVHDDLGGLVQLLRNKDE